MARRTKERAAQWSRWLANRMGEQGARQVDLVAMSDGKIGTAQVSKWVQGDSAPSAEGALLVAEILKCPPAEALRAGGYDQIADLIDSQLGDGGVPIDPVVRKLLAWQGLTEDQKKNLIEVYRRDRALAEQRAAAMAEMLADRHEG